MEGLIVSTLGKGGFDDQRRALYVLLLNQYLYIGVTGTSNNTGIYSPHKRLGSHVLKRGSTKSVVWDDVFGGGLVPESELATRMVSVRVDSQLNLDAIERLCIYLSQGQFAQDILLNKLEKKQPSNLTVDEQRLAEDFVLTIIRERQAWVATDYGENTEATLNSQRRR